MQVTFVIHAVTSGGAERVMSILANAWAAKGWSITLLTFDDGSAPPFYPINPQVKHIPLGVLGSSSNLLAATRHNIKRIRTLRSAIRASQPDIIVSFLDTTNVLTLLATQQLGIPVIVNEQIHPAMWSIGRIWEWLRQWSYPNASQVVAVTERALSYFSPQVQARGCVIPNPALAVESSEQPLTPYLAKPSLIAMGRLDGQKGFDLLLAAFAQLKDRHPEWTLTILGEGALRAELESLREQLELSDRVHFLGVVNNPNDFLKQADIFVMSSRFEGFPNALCEAMACGLAVISADCPSGPSEIIRHGVDGLLVPTENVSALAGAMERLMSDTEERNRLASHAPEVTERFSLEKIIEMWENLLAKVIQKRTNQYVTKVSLSQG
ncbi:glycosyltransferase family 4 protein [Myxacorys almedinensis]|uniref:Glycosyltransferase n=1 Tax=Myxacorys almedinensis A TaxID=2690445 RepID=A0A8J7Z0H0_9CYAN|nr:glycosyltransferase family 4 protein [Myxacorys almedinensis]NDJ17879.1 glycosyltransferase [Myxacorys almedinensis A]